MIEELARAKINLFLHVGPVRSDGLHEIESLFVFADDGDRISVTNADKLSLKITGPHASALKDLPLEKNLVWKAAETLQAAFNIQTGAEITLDKCLPAAAGIGGGSADAAAMMRALVRLWKLDVSGEGLAKIAFNFGADVPACLQSRPVIVKGAGETVTEGPCLPPLWVCLINPGVDVPTGPVFKAFDQANPAPALELSPVRPAIKNYGDVVAYMGATRNDLERFARHIAPAIDDVLHLLRNSSGIISARMSGSGATCYGLFSSLEAAQRATVAAKAKNWWTMAASLASQ